MSSDPAQAVENKVDRQERDKEQGRNQIGGGGALNVGGESATNHVGLVQQAGPEREHHADRDRRQQDQKASTSWRNGRGGWRRHGPLLRKPWQQHTAEQPLFQNGR